MLVLVCLSLLISHSGVNFSLWRSLYGIFLTLPVSEPFCSIDPLLACFASFVGIVPFFGEGLFASFFYFAFSEYYSDASSIDRW